MERGGGDARQGVEVLEVKGDVTGVRETDVRSCTLRDLCQGVLLFGAPRCLYLQRNTVLETRHRLRSMKTGFRLLNFKNVLSPDQP